MEKELKISFALEPNVLGLERLNIFEIEVKHSKRGYGSTFNGIVVSVTPLERKEWNGHAIFAHIYDGNWRHQGFRVAIESCARKSPKKMENYFEKIKPYASKIKDLFIKGEDKAILCLLRDVCLGTLNVK